MTSASSGQPRASVEALRRKTGIREIPVEVWIDGDGLVRRLTERLRMRIDGQRVQMALKMTLHDFGPQPSVEAPPASAVYDAPQKGRDPLTT